MAVPVDHALEGFKGACDRAGWKPYLPMRQLRGPSV